MLSREQRWRMYAGLYGEAAADEMMAESSDRNEGWFAYQDDHNPIMLGMVAVSPEFAAFFAEKFPHHAITVAEIQTTSPDQALAEIRSGRWVDEKYLHQ